MPTASYFSSSYERYEHFTNHGDEFGLTDDGDYQAEARAFLNSDRTVFTDILECERTNGDVVRFNPVTNQFAIMTATGTIRTYYKPMPRSSAPPSYPRYKITHPFATNQLYFNHNCSQ